MFAGDYNSAVGGNMAGNDFSAAPKLINGKPRVLMENSFSEYLSDKCKESKNYKFAYP